MARQTPAKHDSSAVVSSSDDSSASSRKAMRVISRAFHKRKARKFSAGTDFALQSFRTNLRNRQKMNQRFFAKREIVQEIPKRTVPAGSNLVERRFNLVR